jgi:hypothetical protein
MFVSVSPVMYSAGEGMPAGSEPESRGPSVIGLANGSPPDASVGSAASPPAAVGGAGAAPGPDSPAAPASAAPPAAVRAGWPASHAATAVPRNSDDRSAARTGDRQRRAPPPPTDLGTDAFPRLGGVARRIDARGHLAPRPARPHGICAPRAPAQPRDGVRSRVGAGGSEGGAQAQAGRRAARGRRRVGGGPARGRERGPRGWLPG